MPECSAIALSCHCLSLRREARRASSAIFGDELHEFGQNGPVAEFRAALGQNGFAAGLEKLFCGSDRECGIVVERRLHALDLPRQMAAAGSVERLPMPPTRRVSS